VQETAGVQLGPTQAYKLESMGLVTLLGDKVYPGCEIYRQFFQGCLAVQENDSAKITTGREL
jgi:AAA-like domain